MMMMVILMIMMMIILMVMFIVMLIVKFFVVGMVEVVNGINFELKFYGKVEICGWDNSQGKM